ncbi:MAG: hypothetical protein SNG45_05435 [Rikenellaceae bacterium]
MKDHTWILRSLFHTIWFNFHYLPLNQAAKLPILLYKPKFVKFGGALLVDSQYVSFGMIRLGKHQVSIYPNGGITFENHGGTITFKGKCSIGGNSAISVGKNGNVVFGERFGATTTFKLVSYNKVVFSDNVLFGWDCLVMDTDFHKLTNLDGGYSKGYGEVHIGSNNWFGCKCSVFKNTVTPNYCTVSTGSILNKKYDFPEYSLIGASNTIEVKAQRVYRDAKNDSINYK